MAHPSSANGPTAEQKDIPALPAKPAPPPEDLYDYRKCTIMLVMQIRPQQQEGGPRPVLVGVQNGTGNKEDLPLYRLLASEEELGGPLPPALAALLEDLAAALPARQQRHTERVAKKTVSGGAATKGVQKPGQTQAKDAGKQKKPGIGATATSAPPPVPTTANPLPKGGLVFGGLFDDL